jgi:dTDP-4-amino-4,6-dideoxygalactose transaminase
VKQNINDLAIFGGAPLYAKPRSVAQLNAPPFKEFLMLVREAYDARRLTNDGPLVRRLEHACAAVHRVPHCIAVTNAGIGISMLLRELSGGRSGEVIVPGFSFRGLPHFIRWAGQTPRFVDVDPLSHTLDVAQVEQAVTPHTTAILAVANSHSFGARDALCDLAALRGIPLVFDSVYALGAQYRGQPPGRAGVAEVFSLHATKLLNGFEGGYITTADGLLAARLRSQRNFALGDTGSEKNPIIGLNGKLNEIHAAMALATLPHLSQFVSNNRERFSAYETALADCRGLSLLRSSQQEVEQSSHTLNVLEIDSPWPYTRDEMLNILRAEGMLVHPYYSPPLYRAPMNPPGVSSVRLPVSELLAHRYLQLPSGNDMRHEDIQAFAALCRFLYTRVRDLKAKLEPVARTHETA